MADEIRSEQALAEAVVALRRVLAYGELPGHAQRAVEACEDLLGLYAEPKAALSVVKGGPR